MVSLDVGWHLCVSPATECSPDLAGVMLESVIPLIRLVLAVNEPALQHGEHVYLCERANPQALAEAIVALKNDPTLREKLAIQGQRLYFEQFDLVHNGQRYAAALQEVRQA